MKGTYILTMSRDEVQRLIPYAMICETMGGAKWNTGTRRRKWANEFTEQERRKARELYNISRQWYLIKGIPDEVKMSATTLTFWNRLAEFCACL